MTLRVLLGGARSGKSTLALRLATASGAPVTFFATAEARDEEFAMRIARHRRERPSGWQLVEEPIELHQALGEIDEERTVVIDCLTLWVANLAEKDLGETEIVERAAEIAIAAAKRAGLVLVVSNEVGSGIVPADPSTRVYRDILGRVNATFVEHSTQAHLVVAGRGLLLEELGNLPPDTTERTA
jgi:adenosyl cobinamide kinase/adenosyl cobinamide phosphate guanylyltransferase